MTVKGPRLTDRVRTVFSIENNRSYGEEFLKEVRQNRREVTTGIGRVITSVLLLMAAFELLVRASIEKVSIGPLELGDLSLLRKALPVVIAYYFYDLVTKYSQDLVYSNVENTMLEILHKDIVDYDLGGVLEPVGHPIQGMELDWSLTNAFGTILNVGFL